VPKYEIRFHTVTHHPTYIVADTKQQAIEKICEINNKRSKNVYRPDQIAYVEVTDKVPLESVANSFTSRRVTGTNVAIDHIELNIDMIRKHGKLILEPDFRHNRAWTEDQQIAYVEFLLRGGQSGRIIYFNVHDRYSCLDTVLVDGLQRLTAVRKFMANELTVFGSYTADSFEYLNEIDLIFFKNNLKTRKEVIQWYLGINGLNET
jgi:hypothetical protein